MKKINLESGVNFSGVFKVIKNLPNKLYKQIEHWDIPKIVRLFVAAGIVIGIGASWFGYQRIYMNPERRFWSAVNSSMSLPSVTRTLTEGGSGNQVVQDHRFYYAPQNVVENKVSFNNKSATVDTSVVTEGIVYPTEQYLRYSSFSTNQLQNGNPVNLDSLLGLWATDKDSANDPEMAKTNFVSEKISLAIFGNYSSSFRRELITQMKQGKVYGTELNTPTEVDINGRKVLRYSVNVDLKKYVAILQSSLVKAGYGEFPPLNTDNYREGSKVKAGIAIDKKSGAIVTVEFGGRTENYSNHGVIKNVQKPEASFSIDELQAKVEQTIGAGL